MKARITRPLSILSLGAAFALGSAIASAEPAAPQSAPIGHVEEPGEAGHAAHHAGALDKIRTLIHELADHADERLVTLKSELKITDAQLPQWNALAEAIRSAARAAAEAAHHDHDMAHAGAAKPARVYGGERSYPDAGAIKKISAAPAEEQAPASEAAPAADPSEGLPARLEAHEKRLAEHLERLKAIKAALDPLYATFSDEQKKVADGLKVGPFGVL